MEKIEKKSILIGTLLGDSCLYRARRCKNFNLQFTHSEKQYDYAKYKATLINRVFFGENDAKLWMTRNNGYNKITAYTYRMKVDPLVESVRKLLYKGKRKTITRKVLDCLTPRGIAWWYMDDGFKRIRYKPSGAIHYRQMGLSTCSFTAEEHDIIIKYFKEKWDVTFHKYFRKQPNNWILQCGAIEGLKFQKIIDPYVPSCMRYKLFWELSIRNLSERGTSLNADEDMVQST